MLAVVTSDSSEDDTEAGPPPHKKAKREPTSTQPAQPHGRQDGSSRTRRGWRGGGTGGNQGDLLCYACGEPGHFADRCPDPVAKAHNDAYLASHRPDVKPAGNEERA
jgi:hypothetical protein